MVELAKKIKDKKAKIGIIGLGYVGLPLAVEFAGAGFEVHGLDTDIKRVKKVNRGISYILDVSSRELRLLVQSGHLKATADERVLKEVDAIIICVPTPLRKTREPDISYILSATEKIAKRIRKGQLIVLESTTFPGTTHEIILPKLESKGLKAGEDFYLAFSPERVDPGNKTYTTSNIPKVVGGITKNCTNMARLLYGSITRVVPVSSSKVAEMVKLLENTFRAVNIGLINEMALMCDRLDIDVWEVIDAARTKPFGFMPFYPGPGIGGECIDKEEFIFIKHGNEKGIKAIKIGDFVSQVERSPLSTKQVYNGTTLFSVPDVYTLSYDRRLGKTCFKKIKLVSVREYADSVIRIITDDNRKLKVTKRHPLLVYNNGIKIKFAEDLQREDELLIFNHAPSLNNNNNNRTSIDLIEYFKNHRLRHNIRIKSKILKFKDCKKHLIPYLRPFCKNYNYKDYFRGNYIPFDVFTELEKKRILPLRREDMLLCTGRGPSYNQIPAVINLSEGFCRLIGYYLSEGCICEDKTIRVYFSFGRKEKEYISDVEKILKVFGLKYSEDNLKKWKTTRIKVSSKIFGILIRDILNCGTNSYTMQIPSLFFEFSDRYKLSLLSGILRGDGGVEHVSEKRQYEKNLKRYCHNRNTATVSYYSASPVLFQQIIFLLQGLHFIPSFKKREGLLNLCGDSHLKRLVKLFDGQKKGRLDSYFKNKRKILPSKSFKSYGSFATVKIKNIERATSSKVCSLEVEDTNTFVTSYGIITHNCIPADPIYLLWRARLAGFEARFIELASQINSFMPHFVVDKISYALNTQRKPLKGSKVFIIGIAYKSNVSDTRESPALIIIKHLMQKGALVSYHDPYVPLVKLDRDILRSTSLNRNTLRKNDCVVIVTDHADINYHLIAKESKLIVDTRNALRKYKKKKIVKL
jgi:nucleotide sugar dehydrogenase